MTEDMPGMGTFATKTAMENVEAPHLLRPHQHI